MTDDSESVVVWRFVDGKPGHEKQSLGLLQGLSSFVALETITFDTRFNGFWRSQISKHLRQYPGDVPVPDLIVGVGHATHLPILTSRAVCGGKSVVLMNPTLPHRLFDLVLVPMHDRYLRNRNVVETRGVICPANTCEKSPNSGLILLGGINRHFEWRDDEIIAQIRAIVAASPEIEWTLCDSRRTPETIRAAFEDGTQARFVPWQDTSADYLEQALARSELVWVTADSVSMLYESLTAQALVGVISLPRKNPNRGNKLLRGIRLLRAQGHVHLTDDGFRMQDRLMPPHFYSESMRCGQVVAERLLATA